ncbi:MAG: ABC transporter substrate-binding protein, partial [Dehalococcoidia bacterium]|nr:ABC transporter substrate-binding protein [Dehalococcoidia bacterium]
DAGQINYAITGVGGAINAILQGSKSKIVGFGEARAATAGYLVPVDSPIKSYKDIKGKTIAFASPGGYTHWIALASIRAAGLQASDVKLLPAGGSPEAYAAVLAGAADAFHATDGTGSIMVTQGKVRWGWKDTDVIPQLPSSCIYVSEREINDRPDQLKAFLKVYQRADEYIVSNLDDALVMWTSHPKVAQAGMTLDIARKLGELYPIPKEAWTTKLNVEALQTTENLMLETNVIKAKVAWDKVIDQRFLREDLQRVDLSKL